MFELTRPEGRDAGLGDAARLAAESSPTVIVGGVVGTVAEFVRLGILQNFPPAGSSPLVPPGGA